MITVSLATDTQYYNLHNVLTTNNKYKLISYEAIK